MWVDLKYFQNKAVAEHCRNKLYLTSVPSSSECCVSGSHLMKSVFLADCSWWLLWKWGLVGGSPGQTQRNQTRTWWNLSWTVQKVISAKMPQLKVSVLAPGFFSYNIWIWVKKFCFSLLAVTHDHIPVIEVMYFLPTSRKDDKQYCYVSLECVLMPATSLASEEQTSFPQFWFVGWFFLFVCLHFVWGFFVGLVFLFFWVFFLFCLSTNFFAMLIFFNCPPYLPSLTQYDSIDSTMRVHIWVLRSVRWVGFPLCTSLPVSPVLLLWSVLVVHFSWYSLFALAVF